MLTINIICVGKIKEKFYKDAINEYSKRLSRYCKLEILEFPDEKIPNNPGEKTIEEIKEKECNRIFEHIKKDSFVICLDSKGAMLSSEELSKEIDELSLSYSHITFVIGGSLGLTKRIMLMANKTISFSKMTFPHQLIRVFLLEQIYRSFKISSGETYHK